MSEPNLFDHQQHVSVEANKAEAPSPGDWIPLDGPDDETLRKIDHDAQAVKSAKMYQASPGGIDMQPVYAAGRRALFNGGRGHGYMATTRKLERERAEMEKRIRFYQEQIDSARGEWRSARVELAQSNLRLEACNEWYEKEKARREKAEAELEHIRNQLAGISKAVAQ